MRIVLFSLSICLCGNVGGQLAAGNEEWPAFRGARQGHAPADAKPPLTWSSTQNIRWKTPIPGKAWSSPIVSGNIAFVTTAVETQLATHRNAAESSGSDNEKGEGSAPKTKLSLLALAVRLSDGKVLWKTEVFEAMAGRVHKKNSHASPTPVHEDGKVYAHYGTHGTACLEAATGKILWRQNRLSYQPVHGSGSSPILVGEKVIYSADGAKDPSLIALNKSDGSVAWKKSRVIDVRRKFSFCTPLLIEVNGEPQVISPCSGAVAAYRPDDGEEIWRCRWGEGYSVTPRPVYAHGLIFASSGFDRAVAYAIRTDGSGDVTDSHVAWTYSKTVPRESSFIVVGDEFYMNDDKGVLTCLDAKTGKFHYAERLSPEGGYSASPLFVSGHLFFTNGEGVTTVVKPGPDFEKVAENRLGEYGLSTFAVLSDGFLHRTENHLIRIGK